MTTHIPSPFESPQIRGFHLLWLWLHYYGYGWSACISTSIIMYFIRTRSTETTTHTIHNYHGTHYYQPCPGII